MWDLTQLLLEGFERGVLKPALGVVEHTLLTPIFLGMVDVVPRFASGLQALRGSHHLSAGERAVAGELPPVTRWTDGRTGLDPARYARLLARESIPSARVAAIVFSRVIGTDSGLRAAAIDPSAAALRLEQTLFGVADLRRRSQLFDHPAAGAYPSEDEIRARARCVVADIPSYVWNVGRAAPTDMAGLSDFLEGLG